MAARWLALVEQLTGGDPEILKGLQAMMADQTNWPVGVQKGSAGNLEAARFIEKAIRVRKKEMGMVASK